MLSRSQEELLPPTVVKIEPPLIDWVCRSVGAHSEERNLTHTLMSPGEYPPPAHDPDVKLSDKYGDPFVKHVRFADPPANTGNMAFPVVEFSRQGYKIRKVFGKKSTLFK